VVELVQEDLSQVQLLLSMDQLQMVVEVAHVPQFLAQLAQIQEPLEPKILVVAVEQVQQNLVTRQVDQVDLDLL
jgi:hypothetical protein